MVRWITTTVSVLLATPELAEGNVALAAAVLCVIVVTLVRVPRPVASEPRSWVRRLELLVESTVLTVAVLATGGVDSPIAFVLLSPVVASGFLFGFGPPLRIALGISAALTTPVLVSHPELTEIRTAGNFALVLLLVAVVTAYTRRITVDVAARHGLDLDQLERLDDANELLFKLHRVAQDLPASLDLDEVLDSTIQGLDGRIDYDAAALLLLEETDGSWTVARRRGTRLGPSFSPTALPVGIQRAAREDDLVQIDDLRAAEGPGLSSGARCGMYLGLRAREFLVGVLVVERVEDRPFSAAERSALLRYAEPAALSLDNARWFGRLRTVGADEERTRIARDLHDRIGQSLAYLAFELDRIVRKQERGKEIRSDLDSIREDVRGVVREVRDTLYDLRTEVTAERTVPMVLEEFVQRVRDRSGMDVVLDITETARMTRNQERELWRIAQEAIVNAERHSGGTEIRVRWFSNGTEARVEVHDDGRGLPAGAGRGRLDSYGMMGMRERASAIGAQLRVDSQLRKGVRVVASLDAVRSNH